MHFKFKLHQIAFLLFVTVALGIMQVLTPLYLRALIDGVLPGKDLHAITIVLVVIALNEFLMILTSSFLNRYLDGLETVSVSKLRAWMLAEVTKPHTKLKNADEFYSVWSNDTKRAGYKKIKIPWFRTKEIVVLGMLSLICLNISYLAGLLILLICLISFIYASQSKLGQGSTYHHLNQRHLDEKNLFQIVSSGKASSQELDKLKQTAEEINELQFQFSRERSSGQDFGNSIRFTMTFSILGLGGYLYATDAITMGTLWALLITMYRVINPIQSLSRWLLQSRSDERVEDKIYQSVRNVETNKKPPFYNRLVKLIEKSLSRRAVKLVVVDKSISLEELKQAVENWASFYSKKEEIIISDKKIEELSDDFFYFLFVPQDQYPKSATVFSHQRLEGFSEVIELQLTSQDK